MFADLPSALLARMRELEAIDSRDRKDGTPRLERLRQVPPETGRFLALTAAASPPAASAPGAWVEIGTSAGYSAIWIALAARERGARLVTFEVLAEKARLARETFAQAGVGDVVELREGDALAGLESIDAVSFAFLDAEKDVYLRCWDLLATKLVPGGLILADNVISHHDEMADFLAAVAADRRIDSVVVPIGKGVLMARRTASRF